jgi:hypothetical protein
MKLSGKTSKYNKITTTTETWSDIFDEALKALEQKQMVEMDVFQEPYF